MSNKKEKKVVVKDDLEKEVVKDYTVAVTAFHFKGKMFRANEKISAKIYKDYIDLWLEEGKVR